jgi:hypothetical protein
VGATCIPSRGASREATSPLVANPRATSTSRKRVVRRAYDGTSGGEWLSKNCALADGIGTKELADREPQGDVPTGAGKISHLSPVAAVDVPSLRTTQWAAGFG